MKHLRVKGLPGHVWCGKQDVLRGSTTTAADATACKRCLQNLRANKTARKLLA